MQGMKYGKKILRIWKMDVLVMKIRHQIICSHEKNSGWYVGQERWKFKKRLNMGKKMDEMKWNPRQLNIWWYVWVMEDAKCQKKVKSRDHNEWNKDQQK